MGKRLYWCEIQDTEFGRALNEVIPPETQRIIIDIPCDEAIKVYYQTLASDAMLNLAWANLLKNADVISAEEKVKGCTND